MLLEFENLKFSETLYIDYHLSKFQIFCLSGSNFMEASVRYQFCTDFVEHNISYHPCKFQLSRMSGSNFTEGAGKHPPPQCCTRRKSPVLLGLRQLQTSDHRFRAMSTLISAASPEKWIGVPS